jgi:hypothetical protein
MFTAIFAMARTVGWIAQWSEMISDPDYKIGRPRQLYVGAPKRDVPAAYRKVSELPSVRAINRKQASSAAPVLAEAPQAHYCAALSGHASR